MNKEKIENFDKEQLELLLNDLQDIDKFTGFKNGAFKYELGKYQANLLVNCIKKQKEVIDKATNNLQQIIDNVEDRTIISLGQFIPKLETIQDELNGSNDILKGGFKK